MDGPVPVYAEASPGFVLAVRRSPGEGGKPGHDDFIPSWGMTCCGTIHALDYDRQRLKSI
jgi:hypothetical protein